MTQRQVMASCDALLCHSVSVSRKLYMYYIIVLINTWRMREGYGSCSVSVSVATLAATYLVCKSQIKCQGSLRHF